MTKKSSTGKAKAKAKPLEIRTKDTKISKQVAEKKAANEIKTLEYDGRNFVLARLSTSRVHLCHEGEAVCGRVLSKKNGSKQTKTADKLNCPDCSKCARAKNAKQADWRRWGKEGGFGGKVEVKEI